VNRIVPTIALFAALVSTCHAQVKLVSLGCDLPEKPEHPAQHFDFTLDQANGTVASFENGAITSSKEKAVFSGDTVTWTTSGFETITRTISRTSLTFTEIVMVGESRWRVEGTCKVINL
jgi:hypothetical protein